MPAFTLFRQFLLISAVALAAVSRPNPVLAAGTDPSELQFHGTIVSPSTAHARSTHEGASVAVNERFVAVGMPGGAGSFSNSSRVNVFDAETGAFRFTIRGPEESNWGFGTAVALSGSLLFVGSPHDRDQAPDAGAVFVHDLDGIEPAVAMRVLRAPDAAESANFGRSIAVSGRRLIVGSPHAHFSFSGKAYVFEMDSATPHLPTHVLEHPLITGQAEFGRAVAISGNRVAVGAAIHQEWGNAGVYVFELAPGGFATLLTTVTNPVRSLSHEDFFGASLALEGDALLIANPNEAREEAPLVYLHDLGGATPAVAKVIFGTHSWDFPIGTAVAVQGHRAFISVFGETGAEKVYEYDLASATPDEPVRSIADPSPVVLSRFGAALAVHGERLVIGAPKKRVTEFEQGIAYLFGVPTGGGTTLRATFHEPLPSTGDSAGAVIAAAGSRLFVGVPGAGFGSVAMYDFATAAGRQPARIFYPPVPSPLNFPWIDYRWRAGAAVAATDQWLVVGGAGKLQQVWVYDLTSADAHPRFILPNVTPPDPTHANEENFRAVVAVSGDWVAVSKRCDTGISNAGVVYVYHLGSSSPQDPVWTLTPPNGEAFQFGFSVALEGSRLVVGAPYEKDGDALRGGAAYVYDLAASQPATPQLRLTQSRPTPEQFADFGSAVALSGGKLAVSAPMDFRNFNNPVGRVYLHDLDGVSPTVATASYWTVGGSQQFGYSLAFQGSRLAVGSRMATHSVYVYDAARAGNIPIAIAKSPADEDRVGDGFGNSVAFVGQSLAVGAPGADDLGFNKGGVYFFGEASGTPAAMFEPFTEAHHTSATVKMRINPAWADAEFRLQLRRFTSFDSTEPYTTVATTRPYGNEAVPWEVLLSNLTPGVTYELRVVTSISEVPLDYATHMTREDLDLPSIRPPAEGFRPRVLTGDHPPLPDYTLQATASDSVGLASFEQDPPPGTPMPTGIHRVTLIATDVANHQVSMGFLVRARPTEGLAPKVVATTGGLAREPGTYLPGIPEDATWVRFEEPAISESGKVGVVGHWRSALAKGSVFTVIKPNGERVHRVQAGDFALYREAKIRALTDPLFASDDSVVFAATLDAADGGRLGAQAICWMPSDEEYVPDRHYPYIAARTDMPVPGIPNATFRSFDAAAVAAGGQVLIRATLKRGPGVTSGDDQVLLRWNRSPIASWNRNGYLGLVLREGHPYGDFGKVVSFQTLLAGAASPGASRGWFLDGGSILPPPLGIGARSVINFSATFEDKVKRIISVRDHTAQVLSANGRAGTAANTDFANVGLPAFREDFADSVVFGAVNVDRRRVLCAVDLSANETETVSVVEGPAAASLRISSVNDVVAAPFGGFEAWKGRMAPRQGQLSNRSFIATSNLGLNGKVVAWAGQDAAGCAPGERWRAFTSIACPGEGTRALFVASLAGRGVSSARDQGVWSVDSTGTPRLLLREGDSMDGKVVADFKALRANALAQGSARAFNSLGQLVVLVSFRDRTSAIVTLDAR